jgi:hypothetical protein
MTNRLTQLKAVQKEGYELFEKKNKDYGDAFANYGSIGVLVRIGDKIQRLMSISQNEIRCVSDESLRDTLIDLHNYSAMAIMLMDEKNNTITKNTKKQSIIENIIVTDPVTNQGKTYYREFTS